ncbi:MAG: hypothetical protein WB624_24690 [Xanthobacteraceae bacterium]
MLSGELRVAGSNEQGQRHKKNAEENKLQCERDCSGLLDRPAPELREIIRTRQNLVHEAEFDAIRPQPLLLDLGKSAEPQRRQHLRVETACCNRRCAIAPGGCSKTLARGFAEHQPLIRNVDQALLPPACFDFKLEHVGVPFGVLNVQKRGILRIRVVIVVWLVFDELRLQDIGRAMQLCPNRLGRQIVIGFKLGF